VFAGVFAVDFDVNLGVLVVLIRCSVFLSGELYLGVPIVTDDAVSLLVDMNVVAILAAVVLDVDIELLLGDPSIFPSARGATLNLNFPFYLGRGRVFGSSVTPVRRREDTNRNGDSSVKVQIVGLWSASTLFSLSAVESQD